MNILHLNTYINKHNLSFPHYQLHKDLIDNGHKSLLVTAKGDVVEDDIVTLNKGELLPYFGISRLTRKVLFEMLMRNSHSYYYPEWNLDCISKEQILSKLSFKPDVIIAYWTKFAFNQKLLYELSKNFNVPVIVYLMDMAPLTGGCHYAYNCENYYDKCGYCPCLNSNKANDLSRRTWEYKKRYIDQTDITIMVGSTTLMNQTKKSLLYSDKKIEKLLLAVDEDIFKPLNKDDAKEGLGINKNKKVIFFGAASLNNHNKGMNYLVEALDLLKDMLEGSVLKDDVVLLIAGNRLEDIEIPFEYKYVGYLKSQVELAQAYQSADLFVCPSIEDSGPLMINLSIVSGCPVVSFDMGVAPDLVFTGETGYRAKLKDSEDLAKGIKMVLELDNEEWSKVSRNCRELGIKLCSMQSGIEQLNEIISRAVEHYEAKK